MRKGLNVKKESSDHERKRKEEGQRSRVLGTFCYRTERLNHKKYCV